MGPVACYLNFIFLGGRLASMRTSPTHNMVIFYFLYFLRRRRRRRRLRKSLDLVLLGVDRPTDTTAHQAY